MNAQTRIRIIALAVLLVSLVSSGVLAAQLAGSVGRNELAYTRRAEDGDPPRVALGIAMGAFRGLFVNVLWIRANTLKEQGKYYEAIELANAITRLQPRFPRVWAFHAWNMSYNISVTTQTPEERYQWVMAGIRLLRDEGIVHNPTDMALHKELGWIYLHKIGGYTDDANQYYKRKVAEEWTIVLGEPPRPEADQRDRDSMIDLYASWLQRIADAPDTTGALAQRNPRAAELADRLRRRVGVEPGYELLRRYEHHRALDRSRLGRERVTEFGPRSQAFAELMADPAYADAWGDLVAHTRKRVLIDDYRMEPNRMIRYTRRFGPIDWRAPAAHSLYWGMRGVELGRMEVNEHNSDSLDFVNTYRIVMQSIQELYRSGEIYFNFLDFVSGRRAYYQAMPNPHFVRAYGDLISEVATSIGIFGSERRAQRPFAAGYENFLRDAIRFFYRRGQRDAAEYWYSRLRTFEYQDVDAPEIRLQEMTLPLDEFVRQDLFDRYASPQVAVSEVTAGLQGAFASGLLAGDTELFDGMFGYASRVHRYYMQEQYRQVVAAGEVARTEYMDRDFRMVAGGVFSGFIGSLPLEEAELVYFYAPTDLRRFAYDIMADRFRDGINEQARAERGRTFEEIFPEPQGMEEFRRWLDRQIDDRSRRPVEGIRSR